MKNLPPRKNQRVLVIDDTSSIHEDFRKVLSPLEDAHPGLNLTETQLFGSSMLEKRPARFEIDSASQGQEGIAMVKKALDQRRPYAMAFVDMQMPPGWDGVKTAQAICRLDSDIQIVICSAYTDYSRQELFTIIGNNDRLVLLSKPFDAVETLELANELTEKWRLIHSNRNKIPSNCPEGGKQEK